MSARNCLRLSPWSGGPEAKSRLGVTDARTAELAKYMENAFFATKVTFVNEFHDIARACDVDFNVLREIWLADPRISRDHTFVYPNGRGFAGKCLPKDLNAIVQYALQRGCQPHLLQTLLAINARFLARNAPPRMRSVAPASGNGSLQTTSGGSPHDCHGGQS